MDIGVIVVDGLFESSKTDESLNELLVSDIDKPSCSTIADSVIVFGTEAIVVGETLGVSSEMDVFLAADCVKGIGLVIVDGLFESSKTDESFSDIDEPSCSTVADSVIFGVGVIVVVVIIILSDSA